MIYFFADNHFGQHCGRVLHEHLPEAWRRRIRFFEDDWGVLESGAWLADCELLALHLIGGTSGNPMPGEGAERAVRQWLGRGGDFLLLHGSSAAFWPWAWWRPLAGLRWVRPGDPDGVPASTHPHAPCRVVPSKSRHPLAARLRPIDLPEDEIYIELEQTAPVDILMTTAVAGATWPQACEATADSGSRLVSFIPGHKPVCTANPDLVANLAAMLEYLTE